MERFHVPRDPTLHHSESGPPAPEVSIVTRKDNPFLSPHGKKKGEEEESDEEDKGQSVVPNVQKDDLARRRTRTGSLPQRDPRQSLAQTSITQSDLEKWQRLSMTIENRCRKNTRNTQALTHTHAVSHTIGSECVQVSFAPKSEITTKATRFCSRLNTL